MNPALILVVIGKLNPKGLKRGARKGKKVVVAGQPAAFLDGSIFLLDLHVDCFVVSGEVDPEDAW